MEDNAFRQDFETVAAIGRLPGGGISRPAFGVADRQAHDWFLQRARAFGFSARYDAFGNAIARMEARPPRGSERAAILIGSHLDTVENGGAFDGALGVVTGLYVMRRLSLSGGLGCPLEVVSFRDEEGRFGPFTGSRAFTGALALDRLSERRAVDGELLVDAMRAAGFDPAKAAGAIRDMSGIAAYIELHIEQGSVLEQDGASLGIVTAIVGQVRMSVRFTGQPDHAGTTPMHMRRDAFAAAARFADLFRNLVLADGSSTLRGTIGIVKVEPNQGNVVPGEVRLGLEIRDIEDAAIERAARAAEELAERVAPELGVTSSCRTVYRDAPVAMDERLRAALEASILERGIAHLHLPSGANHDAGIIGRLVPAALLFVPSSGGRSHCPQEHTDWSHIERAAQVLEATVRRIADMKLLPRGSGNDPRPAG